MIKNYILRHPVKSQRFLEILPGFVSWSLILFPIWGSFLVPNLVAYFVIAFAIYWLWRSLIMAVGAIVAHFRLKKSSAHDWLADLKKTFPKKWSQIQHAIVIPTYKEPLTTLERTLDALAQQSIGPKHLHIALAFEIREGKAGRQKAQFLTKKYGHVFGTFITTFHPSIEGEVVGKSSNTNWGGRELKKELVDRQHLPIENITITCQDADVIFHRHYFANLTYSFLSLPNPHQHSWQGGIVFYNNIWQVPAPVRVVGVTASINQLYILTRKDRLINFSTYSTTLKHVDEIGYWDTDIIPEDYHMFFKSYFAKSGDFSVEPIFLPIYADMPESPNWWATMKNQYSQLKRWAWGVSDDAWVIKQFFIHDEIPFWNRFMRIIKVIEDHFLWPVNWFAITIAATIPPLLNAEFNQTTLGKTLPQVASAILTLALVSLVTMIVIDALNRPKRPSSMSFMSYIIQPFEFILAPVVGFFFSALPGIDAHTRLMMGKKIEYKVTEKM